jgi:hypothetical protein
VTMLQAGLIEVRLAAGQEIFLFSTASILAQGPTQPVDTKGCILEDKAIDART